MIFFPELLQILLGWKTNKSWLPEDKINEVCPKCLLKFILFTNIFNLKWFWVVVMRCFIMGVNMFGKSRLWVMLTCSGFGWMKKRLSRRSKLFMFLFCACFVFYYFYHLSCGIVFLMETAACIHVECALYCKAPRL